DSAVVSGQAFQMHAPARGRRHRVAPREHRALRARAELPQHGVDVRQRGDTQTRIGSGRALAPQVVPAECDDLRELGWRRPQTQTGRAVVRGVGDERTDEQLVSGYDLQLGKAGVDEQATELARAVAGTPAFEVIGIVDTNDNGGRVA